MVHFDPLSLDQCEQFFVNLVSAGGAQPVRRTLYAEMLAALTISASAASFKPVTGNDAVARAPFAGPSIAGTRSSVREVDYFRCGRFCPG